MMIKTLVASDYVLFYVLSVIIVCDYICTMVFLYTLPICTNGAVIDMWLCSYWLLLVCCVIGWVYFTYDMHLRWMLCNYRCICVTVSVL